MQCPTNNPGKAPVVNMIVVDVQQVTTWSKAQQSQWEIQDEDHQTAKQCIEAANKANIDQMHSKMKEIGHGSSPPSPLTEQTDNDPVWQALTSCQISMPLHKLLQLLPRFKETVQSRTVGLEPTVGNMSLQWEYVPPMGGGTDYPEVVDSRWLRGADWSDQGVPTVEDREDPTVRKADSRRVENSESTVWRFDYYYYSNNNDDDVWKQVPPDGKERGAELMSDSTEAETGIV